MSCGSAPVVFLNDPATGSPGISFNAANGTFTYNWGSGSAGSIGGKKVTIRLKDNTVHEVLIKIL